MHQPIIKLRPTLNRLKGKVALLTGASRGIGASLSEVFAHEGARVIIWDRNASASELLLAHFRKIGYQASCVEIDLQDEVAVEKEFQRIVESSGAPDILVHNARSNHRSGLFDQGLKQWDEETNVMLRSVFHLSQICIRAMRERGNGVLLNISSVAAQLTCPESPAYHAAKGGLLSLTRYLASEAGEFGIRVNALCPGHVLKIDPETASSGDAKPKPDWQIFLENVAPLRSVPTALEIAYAALFLSSEESAAITGQTIFVDGGMSLIEQAKIIRHSNASAAYSEEK